MKRNKKSKVNNKKPVPSSATKLREQHDLAYYVDDRVSLMREVFTVLKARDIKKITPACIGELSIDNLEELCLEELLGISSKRLCSILDGAEPPSDTDSSSSSLSQSSGDDDVEVISLSSSGRSRNGAATKKDSNKSTQQKKKQREKRRKKRRRLSKQTSSSSDSDSSDTSSDATSAPPSPPPPQPPAPPRAVSALQLLELQARAQAIQSQLKKASAKPSTSSRLDPDLVIKDEEPEVFVISSEDEKPDLQGGLQGGRGGPGDEVEKESDREAKAKEKHLELMKQLERDKQNLLEKQKERLEKKKKKKEAQANKKAELREQKEKRDQQKLDEEKKKELQKKKEEEDVVLIEEGPPPPPEQKKQSKQHKSDKTDFTITIPRGLAPTARIVQLNRDHVVISVRNENNVPSEKNTKRISSKKSCVIEADFVPIKKVNSSVTKVQRKEKLKSVIVESAKAVKAKKKRDRQSEAPKEKERRKKAKAEVDQDEIMLQLSDTEKQDLLEDLGVRKQRSEVDSSLDSSSDRSESESENENPNVSSTKENLKNIDVTDTEVNIDRNEDVHPEGGKNIVITKESEKTDDVTDCSTVETVERRIDTSGTELKSTETTGKTIVTSISDIPHQHENEESTENAPNVVSDDQSEKESQVLDNVVMKEMEGITEQLKKYELMTSDKQNTETLIEVQAEAVNDRQTDAESADTSQSKEQSNISEKMDLDEAGKETLDKPSNFEPDKDNKKQEDLSEGEILSDNEMKKHSDLSEGEISDKSSEVEAFDVQPVVFCISDEDDDFCEKRQKKKTKKVKKSKHKDDRKASKSLTKNPTEAEPDILKELDAVVATEKARIESNNDLTKTKIKAKDIEKLKEELKAIQDKLNEPESIILDDDGDVYEIMELSDDSSCYEVEGTCLSKEPTAEEIVALSARIDEIKREDVVTDEQIVAHERALAEKALGNENLDSVIESESRIPESQTKDVSEGGEISRKVDENGDKSISMDNANKVSAVVDNLKGIDKTSSDKDNKASETNDAENIENVSWKDRYLESAKVKRVLSTSNILNALRKKNLELKKKMVEAKKAEIELREKLERDKEMDEGKEKEKPVIEEGSIEHYNMLQGSTKYVNPIKEPTETVETSEKDKTTEDTEKTESVSKDMKKDAKRLLKMFKRLLKANEKKDPNRAKKKKQKKSKDKVAKV